MNDPEAHMITLAVRVAGLLPSGAIQTLAQTIGEAGAQHWTDLRRRASQAVPQPHLRAIVLEMIGAWQQHAPDMSPTEIALILRTAGAATRTMRESQAVELVWTGPLVSGSTMRRTDQALLQVINSAKQSLLIVSFAVYKIQAIAAAIVQAAGRGVAIRICVEAPEPSGQRMAHDTIRALGSDVAQRATIYVWPSDQRPIDPSGRAGVLHAKCAVADAKLLFISSANLTDSAMNLNIELGVLVHSETQGTNVVAQFEQLIAQGILRRMPPEA